MSKIDDLIEKFCPNGVEYKVLQSLCGTITTGKLNANAMVENGAYPFFTCDSKPFRIDKYAFDEEAILISGNGSQVGHINYYKGKFNAYQRTYVLYDFKDINVKFLLHYLKGFLKEYILKNCKKGSVPYITLPMLQNFVVPVPSLEVQCEIIHILDDFTLLSALLSAELSAELKARQKQYKYYQTKMFEFSNNIKYIPLEELAEIGTGSSNTNEAVDNGEYPFFVRSQQIYRKNTFEYDDTSIITSGDGVGVGKIFHYVEGKYALHQRAYRIHITSEEIIPKFFYFYMKTTFYDYIMKNAYNSSVTSVRRPMLNNYPVPILSKEEQKRIIDILEKFEKICNDISEGLPAEIEAREKQYEYYRDKLLTFKELKVEK